MIDPAMGHHLCGVVHFEPLSRPTSPESRASMDSGAQSQWCRCPSSDPQVTPRGSPGGHFCQRGTLNQPAVATRKTPVNQGFSAETEGFEPSDPVRGLHLSRVKSRLQGRRNAVKSARSRTPHTAHSPRIGILRMLGVTWGRLGSACAVSAVSWSTPHPAIRARRSSPFRHGESVTSPVPGRFDASRRDAVAIWVAIAEAAASSIRRGDRLINRLVLAQRGPGFRLVVHRAVGVHLQQ